MARKPAAQKAPSANANTIPASPIEHVALRQLRRAPENVRKTAIDADVEPLAENIAANGLLQSLIGYREEETVQIVGGGRRLQALHRLLDDDRLGLDFAVPVLIRDKVDAIELSLSENLERRDMNPADEFVAFAALMAPGTRSPADLAKRFGFTERYVRQRLRLADLVPEVLDALRQSEMTLEAALAYARAADPDLQRQVFKAQTRKGWDPHSPNSIRQMVSTDGRTTNWPLFRYVGAEAYERAGGGYDDGLFDDAEIGATRKLDSAATVIRLAREHLEFQMLRKEAEFAADRDCETVEGWVPYGDILFPHYGMTAPKRAGFEWVQQPYNPGALEKMWKTVRNNGIRVQLLVGVNRDGELAACDTGFYVDKEQKEAVQPTQPAGGYQPPTPEERAKADREDGIALWSKRLAIGPFAGTPLDGRARWMNSYGGMPTRISMDGESGWLVPVHVFVTDEQVAAQADAAAERYEQDIRERREAEEQRQREREEAEAARAARRAELDAIDPPAVVVIDGEAWARDESGAYATIDDGEDGFVDSWQQLLDFYDPTKIDHTFADRADFDAAMAASAAAADAADEPEMREAAE